MAVVQETRYLEEILRLPRVVYFFLFNFFLCCALLNFEIMKKIVAAVSYLLISSVARGDVDVEASKYTNLESVGQVSPIFWTALYNIQMMWLRMNSRRRLEIQERAYVQEKFSENSTFPCNITSSVSDKVPTSVHKLRPGDIKVIGAIGDSLTSASGALSTEFGHMFTENRGLSWSIGGQWDWRNATTLPNILKAFNPNLVGYSLNDSFTYSAGSEFNTAEIGAITMDLLGMAKALVERIHKDPRVDFANDWKLVTITIGANDICSYVCAMDRPSSLPKLHKKFLLQTVRYLRDNLPRTLVNVVSKPRIGQLIDFPKKDRICQMLQLGICSCFSGLFFNATNTTRAWFEKIEEKYMKVDEEVAKMQEFRKLPHFAVVYQPFTVDSTVSHFLSVCLS